MKFNSMIRAALLAALPLAGSSFAMAAGSITGPSSSQSPYVLRAQPGVVVESLLTVGDTVNSYPMVGIPDGLGAFDNDDGTFTVLMNHELGASSGVVRDHGFKGAFVSKWIVDKDSLTVLQGEDLMKHVYTWDIANQDYTPLTAGLTRFCSADLPALTAFYNPDSGLGYNGRIFMNGEESGVDGRAFAHFMDGNSYQLPYLGRFAWENSVAHPNAGDRTVVVGLDDGTGGQVYVYAGDKSNSADPIAAAGLSGGTLYGIKVLGYPTENAATGIPSGTPFVGFNHGDVSSLSGTALNNASVAAQVTTFQRPEDGAWDPINPNDFYFVTTASFTGKSRLWRLRFNDPTNPAAGGTIDMLIDGTELAGDGPKMMDNITVTKRGSVFLQEDVGNNAHLGKIWRYSIAKDTLEVVAQHDADRFLFGAPNFLTQDEESSGIIPMDEILGEGWYLFDVQAHYGIAGELVEGGQLGLLHFPPGREK